MCLRKNNRLRVVDKSNGGSRESLRCALAILWPFAPKSDFFISFLGV